MSNLKLRITALICLVLSKVLTDAVGSKGLWQHQSQHILSENISMNMNKQTEVYTEEGKSENVMGLAGNAKNK